MRPSRRAFLETVGMSAIATAWPARLDARSSPLEAYPQVVELLRREANRRSRPFSGAGIELRPNHGAFAAALDLPELSGTNAEGHPLSPGGLLTFAIDVADTAYATAELHIEPAS